MAGILQSVTGIVWDLASRSWLKILVGVLIGFFLAQMLLDFSSVQQNRPSSPGIFLNRYSQHQILWNGKSQSNSTAIDNISELQPSCKKWRLTACAVVHNEVAYLPEWIEFHRLQGVDHFVLYTYLSNDLAEYLPALYEVVSKKFIHVEPINFFGQKPKNPNYDDFVKNQQRSMAHCYNHYGVDSEWIVLMQPGYFLYAAENSVAAFLDTVGSDWTVSVVTMPVACYGTSGQRTKFATWIAPNAHTGKVDLFYEYYNAPDKKIPLVIESNLRRAPHRLLDVDYITRRQQINFSGNVTEALCNDENSPLIIRNNSCSQADADQFLTCLKSSNGVFSADLSQIRADSHQWRSVEHFEQSVIHVMPAQNVEVPRLDNEWFSLINDSGKLRFAAKIQSQLRQLEPKVFLEIGRECVEEALKSGQQMMCPKSHPFPYGSHGNDYLRQCCEANVDFFDKPLTDRSTSCKNHHYIDCDEPKGVFKWWHRSCCVYDENLSKFARYKL